MSVNKEETYPNICFLLKSWLFGTLPKGCLQTSRAHSLPITVVWPPLVSSEAPPPLLCRSVDSGPGTSVELRSSFPGRDKICVVFNLFFLSRSRPSIQNWEQVTSVSQRMVTIPGILKKKWGQENPKPGVSKWLSLKSPGEGQPGGTQGWSTFGHRQGSGFRPQDWNTIGWNYKINKIKLSFKTIWFPSHATLLNLDFYALNFYSPPPNQF